MRWVTTTLKWLLIIVVVIIVAAGVWLCVAPPDLVQVANGYSAKMVCSNAFVADRDPGEVLRVDVQAPGNPVLTLVGADVDRQTNIVSASLLSVFGKQIAVARDGIGCTSVPDGDITTAREFALAGPDAVANADAEWPEGERVDAAQSHEIAAILDDASMTGPGMRAVVVVHDGRIAGERYGEGFSAATPLLGWSMTKTVTAAIVGTLVGEGRLTLDQTGLLPRWDDDRGEIALSDLMAMSSGLEFNEDYGDVTDVTRMLYLEPDMAGFAAGKPLAYPVGDTFSYSSGTAVIVSRIWQNTFEDAAKALAWPRKALFDPLGMTSAVIEADARGTFVGSSYMYATAHDWARFGQFLLDGGRWDGTQILPSNFVAWMREPAPASDGQYGHGMVWLHGPQGDTPAGANPDAGSDLPDDAFWMLGHDGQTVAIIPSKRLVVVRLGLTPSNLGYKPQPMVAALAATLD